MNMQILELIGFLCMFQIMELFFLGSFGVENIPTEVKKVIGNKNIQTHIFRIHENNSITCGYFCIGFINFMMGGKSLIDYTSLVSPYDLKKDDNIIFSYFKNELSN